MAAIHLTGTHLKKKKKDIYTLILLLLLTTKNKKKKLDNIQLEKVLTQKTSGLIKRRRKKINKIGKK